MILLFNQAKDILGKAYFTNDSFICWIH